MKTIAMVMLFCVAPTCLGDHDKRVDLSGMDFSHQDLSDANFSYVNLAGAIFSGANLKNAILYNADQLSNAVFDAETVFNQWTVFPTTLILSPPV